MAGGAARGRRFVVEQRRKYMARELLRLLFMVYTVLRGAAKFEAMFHVYKVVNLLIGH